MSWVTVYIKGRKSFQKEVLLKLQRTWLRGSYEANNDLIMFWIEDASRLRSMKIAIGSKLIFKYRLHFFTDLNFHLKTEKSRSTELATPEAEIVPNMVRENENLFERVACDGNAFITSQSPFKKSILDQFPETGLLIMFLISPLKKIKKCALQSIILFG